MDINFGIAQVNLTVGDFAGNFQIIDQTWQRLEQEGAELILFPELTICGYNPQDLVLRAAFRDENIIILKKLVELSRTRQSAIIIGAIREINEEIFNSAFVIYQGEVIHHQDKVELPNFGVFDEKRLYTKGQLPKAFTFKNYKIGLLICADSWNENSFISMSKQNPDVILIMNASPFEIGKYNTRREKITTGYKHCASPIIYCNLIGGQDNIVFDGASFALDKHGKLVQQLKRFEEELAIINFADTKSITYSQNSLEAEIYQALMLALHDYLAKNNLNSVVLGLSGGIDSALTAAIAIDALGTDKVKLITLPSRYNSKQTFMDSEELLHSLGTHAEEISIEPILTTSLESLTPIFDGTKPDITEENLQSRIRGLLLMAVSNKFGSMLLSTGNKSELAVGYATIYGDMNGGYNLLKDLYKTQIYQLAAWRNKNMPRNALGNKGIIIPEQIITKAPSAELNHNQKDSDSLPDYPILDSILYKYIELGLAREQIISDDINSEIVDKVLKLIKIGEFKRNQSTLGPKISTKSFGLDWRYPITNKFTK